MKLLRATSFRRYALNTDILMALATLLFVLATGWLTLQELNRQHLDARVMQAAGIPLFLEQHITRARQALLQAGSELLGNPAHMDIHLGQFAEIYRVDAQLRIIEIYKAVPNTHIFPGFSLAPTNLAAYLQATGDKSTYSPVMRSYSDDTPTIYIAVPINGSGDTLLGALNLEYINAFMQRYSAYSGNPIYMLNADGFVMFAAGSPPGVVAFDVRQLSTAPTRQHILQLGGQRWIPVASETLAAGIRMVTLLSVAAMDQQRHMFLIFVGIFIIWLLVELLLRSLRNNIFIFKPLTAFLERIRTVEQAHGATEEIDKQCSDCSGCGFEELRVINDTFTRMAKAIRANTAQLQAANAQLEALAVTDGLTNLASRRHFDNTLKAELARLQRSGGYLSLLLLDVDYFKPFNDSYGHTAGDECLRQVAALLGNAAQRTSDLAARYGGEEFAIILPDTTAATAKEIAERVRVGVEQLAIPHLKSLAAGWVTVSIGAVTIRPRVEDSLDTVVALADGQLYAAKHEGRNRVKFLNAAGKIIAEGTSAS